MSNKDFLSQLAGAARENPFAATLIAGGLLWSLTGNRPITSALRAATQGATAVPTNDDASHRLNAEPLSRLRKNDEEPGIAAKAASAINENLVRWKDAAGEGLSGVRDRVSDLPDPRPALTASYDEAKTALADLLERQPLVLGVVGISIGAAIAGAFKATVTERDLAGAASAAVRSDLAERAGAVGDRLGEGAESLKAELSNTAAEALDRLKKAGQDAIAPPARRQASRRGDNKERNAAFPTSG